MGNVARARGEAAKEILALLSERTLSTDEIAKALKIANGSARYHLTIMLKARSIHIDHWERRTYRMNPMRVFAIGDGEDAPIPVEWKGKKRHEVMTPVRDEITAALFGAVNPKPLGEYASHLYKQFA